MSNKNEIKGGSLVTAGFYTFNLKPEIKEPKLDSDYSIIMINRTLPFPIMVVQEIKTKADKETGELLTYQARCRWFSLKSMNFHEKWFDINLLSEMDINTIKSQISTKILSTSIPILERKINALSSDLTVIYKPALYEKVRLKTYILEKYRYAKNDHSNKHYIYKSPVLAIIEIADENHKHKGLVRCLWYNPADDKYDDNLWLHPSVLMTFQKA